MADLDVEDESLLAALFHDSLPEGWRDNPDSAAYLAELSASGLEPLRREPERLAEQRALIRLQTRELAFANYQTFIRTADCTRHIYRDFGRVEASVSRLLDKLPCFGDKCRAFVEAADHIGSSRRMNSLTLNRHTEILEILEIPQLMDTCVRNGYYEEALELAAYVRRLDRKHGTLPVIQAMVCEVRQSVQLMLGQLLQQLRGSSPLPACLRVVGYLRRMDVFTEAELRLQFLQARGAWLAAVLAAVPRDDAYAHISRTIEALRVHLFDVVTQYRAIFSDEDPPPASGGPAAPAGPPPLGEAAIFQGWLLRQVCGFLAALAGALERGVGGRLDSLLAQCMYFGLSFSRVGADFRGQLAPLFQRAAAAAFRRALDEAAARFREDMDLYTLTAPPGPAPGMAAAAAAPGSLQPPQELLDFPPLAGFLNGVLGALNELRPCCPLGLVQEVSRCLEDAAKTVSGQILAFHRAEAAAFSGGEEQLFLRFCCCYGQQLLPFLNLSLQVLFPPAQLGPALGVPVSQLTRF
ncbi:conserved oligomeric Golgi complex subunit 8 isoform 2-T2 [Menidia menidia]